MQRSSYVIALLFSSLSLICSDVSAATVSTTDSANINNLTSFQTMYPTLAIQPPVSPSPAWAATLPPCPGNVNPANGALPAATLCTSANYPNCGSFCVVTNNTSFITLGDGSRFVQSSALGVCPINYLSIYSYNMQQEVVYRPTPATVTNISQDQWNSTYSNTAAYTCGLGGQSGYVWQCIWTAGYAWQSPPGGAAAYTTTLIPSGGNSNSNSYMGQWTMQPGSTMPGEYLAYSPPAWIPTTGYGTGPWCFGPSSNCSATIGCGGSGAWMQWKFNYTYISCTPNTNLFTTPNMAPSSMICGYMNQQWLPTSAS